MIFKEFRKEKTAPTLLKTIQQKIIKNVVVNSNHVLFVPSLGTDLDSNRSSKVERIDPQGMNVIIKNTEMLSMKEYRAPSKESNVNRSVAEKGQEVD